MARKLDPDRPYAEVCGLPGVFYIQDNLYFRRDGTPCDSSEVASPPEESPPPVDNSPLPVHFLEEQQTPSGDDGISDASSIDTMHWKHLKALVESYGGQWTNRKEAVDFLKRGK